MEDQLGFRPFGYKKICSLWVCFGTGHPQTSALPDCLESMIMLGGWEELPQNTRDAPGKGCQDTNCADMEPQIVGNAAMTAILWFVDLVAMAVATQISFF